MYASKKDISVPAKPNTPVNMFQKNPMKTFIPINQCTNTTNIKVWQISEHFIYLLASQKVKYMNERFRSEDPPQILMSK